MYLSLNWIKEFVDVPSDIPAKKLAETITLKVAEVEGFVEERVKFSNMVIGLVKNLRKHPGADRLLLVDTDIGERTVQIVCGGQNLKAGMKVAVALPGSLVQWHGGETVELKETKVRGELSHGMICAGEEIGLSPDNTPTSVEIHIHDLSRYPEKPGTPLADALKRNDIIFEIDNKSLTHRPDLWSHYGFARELSAIFEKKLKRYDPEVAFPKNGEQIGIHVEDDELVRRASFCVLSNVKVEPSPQWLREKLETCGVRPINTIVDITNYVMLEYGQPMHAYDQKKLGSNELVIRFAKKGEILGTIDHKNRNLTDEDPIITNGKNPLLLLGIMGGSETEISSDTKNIVLEAGCWNPVIVRRASVRHSLRTDSSQRFEKSLDPAMTDIAIRRAIELILQVCPEAKIAGSLTDIIRTKITPETITVPIARIQSKIGIPIEKMRIVKIMKALEFEVRVDAKNVTVTPPSFRATKDINIEDDIVEEIARIYGYENIPPQLPAFPITLPRENLPRTLEHRVRGVLAHDLGFVETKSYSFYGDRELQSCGLSRELHREIDNPLSEDQKYLRITLLPNLLKAVAQSSKFRKEFSLFEVGRTYIDQGDYFPNEETFICGIVCHPERSEESQEIFHTALGAIEEFFHRIHAGGVRFEEARIIPPYAHPKKIAAVYLGKDIVGVLYELHPQLLKNFDMNGRIAAFEINFSKLAVIHIENLRFSPLPRFPGIELDVSVIVEAKTPVRDILKLIKKSNQTLIARVELIDTYVGAGIPENKKSLTFRVLLQSPERTLTDEEMTSVQQAIFSSLRSAGFSIRGA